MDSLTDRGPAGRRVAVDGHERLELDDGWEAAAAAPGAEPGSWLPARVPGTAAAALADAGHWGPGEPSDLDAQDWRFRTRFAAGPAAAGEEAVLRLDGIATVAEVRLNGELILESDSMFAAHAIEVGSRLSGDNELEIRCRALAPLLQARRKPRARWRTRLVSSGNLRFFRTAILGRAPGFAPGPAPVGPWRPVWLERRRRLSVDGLRLRPRLEGSNGVLAVDVLLRPLGGRAVEAAEVQLSGPSGDHAASLELAPADLGVRARGELRVPGAAPWWPHTHGAPALHDVRLSVTLDGEAVGVAAGRAGFRALAPGPGHDAEAGGLPLEVNGVPVFARGAVWTPADPIGLAPSDAALRTALGHVCAAGMNMLRIPGTGAYESPEFHDACDELGILVWQDFMFANLDYPLADDAFRATVEREADAVLAELAGRPSLAVLCGNSEIEQQVAMLGLDPALGRGELFGELLPAAAAAAGADVPYVPSAPCGGVRPFVPGAGVANYYGVGGYRRPLADVRAAGVRFAAECLAFANVPEDEALAALLPEAPQDLVVHHPRWKAGVPRDAGTGWDFDDVRDHYLGAIFGVDPGAARRVDHARYLELSRLVTGEAMAAVFGEWRRAGSPCGGGLILWLRDLLPGAGWGVLDHRGEPKAAYHHLRRALAPTALWTVDEGLGGVRIHVAHDGPAPLQAAVRVALYRDFEQLVGQGEASIELDPHSQAELDLEAVLGHFVDASWAYKFGPAAQDAIVVTLEPGDARDGPALAQAVRFPAGWPLAPEPPDRIGLAASAAPAGGAQRLVVTSRRLAYGVRIHAPGWDPQDDAFAVEPGGRREILLQPRPDAPAPGGWALTAANLRGRVPVEAGSP
ncbi:MAG: hypothetical protein U0R70_00170 [Solirubrobacteraceae bacterium]